MPLTEEELDKRLARLRRMIRDLSEDMGRTLRESDRRAEEYLPILRRYGLAPPRRRSRLP